MLELNARRTKKELELDKLGNMEPLIRGGTITETFIGETGTRAPINLRGLRPIRSAIDLKMVVAIVLLMLVSFSDDNTKDT